MSACDEVRKALMAAPKTWLVTGVAGFIGSNLLETLLKLEQWVVGLDNFSCRYRQNLEEVRGRVSEAQWSRFLLVEGDLNDAETCRRAVRGTEFVLHQAALGSVPRSLADPLACHHSNLTGFLTMLCAAREAKVKRFVYASSSAVYGDTPELPQVEDRVGQPLSPYAASKAMDEVYAGVFARAYGLDSVGLRYFNVFGPRQDPNGAYAAVISRWMAALVKREPYYVNGDGESSRDFCYVENVVQANLLAATSSNPGASNQVFNIALGHRTTLNELARVLRAALLRRDASLSEQRPIHREFRAGDIRHSQASIEKARRLLGYEPTHGLQAGLELTLDWFRQHVV